MPHVKVITRQKKRLVFSGIIFKVKYITTMTALPLLRSNDRGGRRSFRLFRPKKSIWHSKGHREKLRGSVRSGGDALRKGILLVPPALTSE